MFAYLGLGPHEGKSHAALEEVQFNKFTGNALLFLEEKQRQGGPETWSERAVGRLVRRGSVCVWVHA